MLENVDGGSIVTTSSINLNHNNEQITNGQILVWNRTIFTHNSVTTLSCARGQAINNTIQACSDTFFLADNNIPTSCFPCRFC